QAWDLAVDICLSQLPTIIEEGTAFRLLGSQCSLKESLQAGLRADLPTPTYSALLGHSPFFAEQLTAFQVWLTMGVENRNPPEQLPIVLQVDDIEVVAGEAVQEAV
ncbi:regulatory-associated protein of mTOR-like, partial [Notothenia coriiceps]|uniref:Regulatory-associated protein of mTOR-like n=1 Tax=Notothenia coriiceps TaxID=8208 RepID=A0A6I9N642_9TELE